MRFETQGYDAGSVMSPSIQEEEDERNSIGNYGSRYW